MSNSTFFSITSAQIISKYQGESEKMIKDLFVLARKKSPSIIFFDEIDSLALSRSESDNDNTRRIKSELFSQMDGLTNNDGVFVIAATNTPYDLDDAILRRFDKLVYIPLPDKAARFKMFLQKFKKEEFSDEILNKFAQNTEGYAISNL